jgi:hypothetical protein
LDKLKEAKHYQALPGFSTLLVFFVVGVVVCVVAAVVVSVK